MSPKKANRISDILLGIMFFCLIGLTYVPTAYFGLLFWIIIINIIIKLIIIIIIITTYIILNLKSRFMNKEDRFLHHIQQSSITLVHSLHIRQSARGSKLT